MNLFRKSKSKIVIAFLVVLTLAMGAFLTGCGTTEEGEDFTEIELAIVDWPGVTQKTYVIGEVLETLGYDVTINSYSLPIILEGMSEGDLEAFTGTWFQTWGTPIEEALEEGRVVHVSTQLEETEYGPAVPTFVYEQGITCLSDLADHAEKFEYTYHGLEPGNDGNQVMLDAFENNTYDLGDWEMIEVNTSAMLEEVQLKIDDGDWVVFSGWEPHWMNVIIDMEYLDDPEGIWGGDEVVGTIVRSGLEEDDPNLYKFFVQFDINSDIQNEWIYEFSRKERDPEIVAKEWVEENIDLIYEWVDGMETPDGRNASEVLEEAYN